MIREALLHLPGIGPKRCDQLREAGIVTWLDLLDRPDTLRFPPARWAAVEEAIHRCEDALQRRALSYLAQTFVARDQWRLLGTYYEEAAFFDIETSGLGIDSHVTVIACWFRDRLHTFVHGENLDDFLHLLDDIDLLVSFNGASFDVPVIERAFHIPRIPCAHIDLRWLSHHQELRGGLKQIEHQLGIRRPRDLVGVDGAEAVWLWDDWRRMRDSRALERLVRYCGADVLSLRKLAALLLQNHNCSVACPEGDALWAAIRNLEPSGSAPMSAAETAEPALSAQRRLRMALRASRL